MGIKPASIALQEGDAGIVEVKFANHKDAELFRRFLPRAGALISFPPAQLDLYGSAPNSAESGPETVLVARQVKLQLTPQDQQTLFHFVPKLDASGQIAPEYRQLVDDRALALLLAFAGPSRASQQVSAILANSTDPASDEMAIGLAKELAEVDRIVGKSNSAIAKRYYSAFFASEQESAANLAQKFSTKLEQLKTRLSTERSSLAAEQEKLKGEGVSLSSAQTQKLALLDSQRKSVESALAILKKNENLFQAANKPLTKQQAEQILAKNSYTPGQEQIISLDGRNPFVEALAINWESDKIKLQFYPDIQAMRTQEGQTEAAAYQKEKLNQLVINEIARVSRLADENFLPDDDGFSVALNHLINSSGFLVINLGYLAEKQSKQLVEQLNKDWAPQNVDLGHNAYPIMDYNRYMQLKPEERKLGLIVYAPSASDTSIPQGFRAGSIYVIGKGMELIAQKYQQTPDAPESQQFLQDLNYLKGLMQQSGFIGYPGTAYGMSKEFAKDYIFELDDYYSMLLRATREDFDVKGSKRFGVLDFTNVEQRLLTLNKIDDRIQEDLLKWKEEYDQAQVDLNPSNRYLVPRPTKNPYWENFKLSFVKYFRGDDRKTLKWGLDLSGGKTVRVLRLVARSVGLAHGVLAC